ncbi:hypothetical protein D046_7104B, partial [Vibrio parahaemolyticus V-223/04]
PTPKTLS